MKDSKIPGNSAPKESEKNGKEIRGYSLLKSLKGFLKGEEFDKSPKANSSGKYGVKVSEDLETDKFTENQQRRSNSKNSEEKRRIPEEEQNINFSVHLKDYNSYKFLKSKKDRIIKITAVVIGIFLILLGVIFSLGSSVQVSSNVIFGERAMFAAFLVLAGFLVLAAVFARRLLEVTFLKKLHQDLEIAEKTHKNKDNHTTRKDDGTDKKG